MRFPLDIVFINNGRVVAIERNAPVPPENADPDKLTRYSPDQPISYVLEVNAHEAKDINIGDKVNIRNFNET
jgi:uncharacterized membrane protein (UPF0127 family)